jgi:hypothetical protein
MPILQRTFLTAVSDRRAQPLARRKCRRLIGRAPGGLSLSLLLALDQSTSPASLGRVCRDVVLDGAELREWPALAGAVRRP